ncbi:MAG: helix-turn-helix domain-containing protein [Lachnospiraceae bacterium]|nr:helix-turn-helix domain-containing protein [Lachnospiraceae bacterium]
MVAEKIKALREAENMTQAALAKKLGITRSSVNAWEMGISVPSTQYVVELSALFKVSTDYLLDIKKNASLSLDGLTEDDVQVVFAVANQLRKKNKNKQL